MSEQYSEHYSVQLRDILSNLAPNISENDEVIFADMTFGAGGHTMALAKAYPKGKVFSVDQDPEAIANGKKILADNELDSRVTLIHCNFENFPEWVAQNMPDIKFTGIVMDLGVSSHHFDAAERGFSYRADAPLDMRMNPTEGISAKDVVNEFSEEELADIFFNYGEEKLSRKIAREIVQTRKTHEIQTTLELENIVFHCYPKQHRYGKTHPATRVFQALRIFVNRELEVLENTIASLYDLLAPNGRLAIISFHSLEDRIVKHKFKDIFQNEEKLARIITKKPLLPSEQEVEENARSRSAKLRIIEKSTMEGIDEFKKKRKYQRET